MTTTAMHGVLYKANGDADSHTFQDIDECIEMFGEIEHVTLWSKPDHNVEVGMYLQADGEGKRINKIASKLWTSDVRGDVFVTHSTRKDSEDATTTYHKHSPTYYRDATFAQLRRKYLRRQQKWIDDMVQGGVKLI